VLLLYITRTSGFIQIIYYISEPAVKPEEHVDDKGLDGPVEVKLGKAVLTGSTGMRIGRALAVLAKRKQKKQLRQSQVSAW